MEQIITWRKSLTPPTLEHAGKLLGVSAVQVLRYERGERGIPATKAAEIERVTGIPRHELRPDIFEASKAKRPSPEKAKQ